MSTLGASTANWSTSHRGIHRLFGDGPYFCTYCLVQANCYCGPQEAKGVRLPAAVADHAVARALGGSDDPSNLVLACTPCNLSKKTLSWPDEWVPNRNATTVINPCSINPMRGDSLKALGAIWALGAIGHPCTIDELAVDFKDTASEFRLQLEKLEREGRIVRHARLDCEGRYFHEYAEVAA